MKTEKKYGPKSFAAQVVELIELFQRASVREVYQGLSEDIVCGLERLQEHALLIELNWEGELSNKEFLRLALATQGWITDERLKDRERYIVEKIRFADRLNKHCKVADRDVMTKEENKLKKVPNEK